MDRDEKRYLQLNVCGVIQINSRRQAVVCRKKGTDDKFVVLEDVNGLSAVKWPGFGSDEISGYAWLDVKADCEREEIAADFFKAISGFRISCQPEASDKLLSFEEVRRLQMIHSQIWPGGHDILDIVSNLQDSADTNFDPDDRQLAALRERAKEARTYNDARNAATEAEYQTLFGDFEEMMEEDDERAKAEGVGEIWEPDEKRAKNGMRP